MSKIEQTVIVQHDIDENNNYEILCAMSLFKSNLSRIPIKTRNSGDWRSLIETDDATYLLKGNAVFMSDEAMRKVKILNNSLKGKELRITFEDNESISGVFFVRNFKAENSNTAYLELYSTYG